MCIWVPGELGIAILLPYDYDGARDEYEKSSYDA
jgi:hypothetical protein